MFGCGGFRATNSTISGNHATGDGGGVLRLTSYCGFSALSNTTVAHNIADSDGDGVGAGGGVLDLNDNVSEFRLRNNIIANNQDSGQAPDCAGTSFRVTGLTAF